MEQRANKNLVLIKVHYFLRFAGSAAMTLFLPVIIRQKGMSTEGIGLMWSVLPFVSLFTNSLAGSIADKLGLHKPVLILGLSALSLGQFSVLLAPSIQNPPSNQFINDNFNDINSQIKHQSSINLTMNDIISNKSVPLEEIYEVNNRTFPFNSRNTSSDYEKNMLLRNAMEQPAFWIIFCCILCEKIGIGISISLSDTICFKILGPAVENYGKQVMWGPIGTGISAFLTGAVVQWFTGDALVPNFTPAFIMCFIIMALDIFVAAIIKVPKLPQRKKVSFRKFGGVISEFHSILFLITVLIGGFSMGLTWTFRLIHVQDITRENYPNFESMELLQGTMMTVETFLGELPFFFLSGMIIVRLGNNVVFSLCLLSVVLRYYFYYCIINPWWFLPVELLNGPGYALFQANMVSYGKKISPPETLSIMQSVIGTIHIAGISLGSLLGGIFYQSWGGRLTFLAGSLIVLVYVIMFQIANLSMNIVRKYKRKGEYRIADSNDAETLEINKVGNASDEFSSKI